MYDASIYPATGFRVANRDDIITAARMVFESYAPYIPVMGKIPPTIFEDFGNHIDNGNLWLLEPNGQAIGMVVLTPTDDHMLLQSLCVMPDGQGKGFGRTLLRFSDLHAKTCGKDRIRLYTNSLMDRNLKIYRRWGYKEIFRGNYEWGSRVYMEKDLIQVQSSKKTRLKNLSNTFA